MAAREKSSKHRPKTVNNTFVASASVEEKPLKYRPKNVNNTFESSSLDSTAIEETLFGQAEEDEDSEDGPVVFICGMCKIPVGDSLSWDGSEVGQNQIRLKSESVL